MGKYAKTQSMDTLVDRFREIVAQQGFTVERESFRMVVTVRKDNWTYTVSEQMLTGVPRLEDLAGEIYRKYAYDTVGQNMGAYIAKNISVHGTSDHSAPLSVDVVKKAVDTLSRNADYTYREPRAGDEYRLTKADVQKMLADMRRGIVEDVMQQVCDEIAKLTDAIERSRM